MEAVAAAWREAGRPGYSKLAQILRRKGIRADATKVKSFVASQTAGQVIRHQPRTLRGKIASHRPNARWQIDLLERTQRGEGYALVAVDVYSRKVAAAAMPNKTPGAALEAFGRVARKLGGNPAVIEADLGKEFLGEFQAGMRERGVTIAQKDTRVRNTLALVDSAIARLKLAMTKEESEGGGRTFAEMLGDAAEALNKRPMDALAGAAPEDVEENSELQFLLKEKRGAELLEQQRARDRTAAKLQPGDRYRVLLPRRNWERVDDPKYGDRVYEVAEVTGSHVTATNGETHKISWTLPVPKESRTAQLPESIRPGNRKRDAERRDNLRPHAEALKAHMLAQDSASMNLREAGTWLTELPGFRAQLAKERLKDVREFLGLYPNVFEVRGAGEGWEATVRLRRRRLTGKQPTG